MFSSKEESWDATASAAAEEDLERYLINDVRPTASIEPNSNTYFNSVSKQLQSPRRELDRDTMKPRNAAPMWRRRSPPRRWQGPSPIRLPPMNDSRHSRDQEEYAREREAFHMRHHINDQWGNRSNYMPDIPYRPSMGPNHSRWEEERYRTTGEFESRRNALHNRSYFNTGESLLNRTNFNMDEPLPNRSFSTMNELNGDQEYNWNHSQINMRDRVVEQGRSQDEVVLQKKVIYGYYYKCRDDVLHDSWYDPPISACINCWKEGHKRPNCPEPSRQYCKNCGRRDIDMSICPRCKDGYPAFIELFEQRKEMNHRKQQDFHIEQASNECDRTHRYESENEQNDSRLQEVDDFLTLELDSAKAAAWAQETVSDRECEVRNFLRNIAYLPTETQSMLIQAVYSPLPGPIDDDTIIRCPD